MASAVVMQSIEEKIGIRVRARVKIRIRVRIRIRNRVRGSQPSELRGAGGFETHGRQR